MEPGDRVKMTHEAIKQGLNSGNKKFKHSPTGTVISVPRKGYLRIKRDHRKTIELYHESFWEKMQ
jgi:hypothetical protein